MARRKTNEEFQMQLAECRKNGQDVYCDDEYVNNHTLLNFYCSKGHTWQAKPNWIFSGQSCPYCLNRRVLAGYNDLWTTHPEIAELLQNPEDGYKYTYGSKHKTYFICPNCGNIIFKTIKEVCNRGLACQRCGDGVSYPNKFIRSLLSQFDIKNVSYEYSPEWLRPYFFDNYFEINDSSYIVEADGGIGHGNKVFRSNEIDTDGIERDEIKDKRAQEHNINVIRIDCCYKNYNKYEYIKQHVIDSELADIFDLSCVDWNKCHLEALSSLVYESAKLYNDGYSIGDISSNVGYTCDTITRWLKQATDIGLCEYSQIESRKRGRRCLYHAVNQYTKDGIFIKTYLSLSIASSITGINLTSIANCCKRKKSFHTAGGYKWFYANDPEQPDKTKVIDLTTQN